MTTCFHTQKLITLKTDSSQIYISGMKQFNSLLTPFLIVICALFSLLFSSCEEGECDEPILVEYNVTYGGEEIHVKGYEYISIPQEGGTFIFTPAAGASGLHYGISIYQEDGIEEYGSLWNCELDNLPAETEGEWGTLKVIWDRNGSWETHVRQVIKMVLTLSPNTQINDRITFVGESCYPFEGGLTITQPGLGDSD